MHRRRLKASKITLVISPNFFGHLKLGNNISLPSIQSNEFRQQTALRGTIANHGGNWRIRISISFPLRSHSTRWKSCIISSCDKVWLLRQLQSHLAIEYFNWVLPNGKSLFPSSTNSGSFPTFHISNRERRDAKGRVRWGRGSNSSNNEFYQKNYITSEEINTVNGTINK